MQKQLDRIEEKIDRLIQDGAASKTDISWLKAGFKTITMTLLGVVGYIIQTFFKGN